MSLLRVRYCSFLNRRLLSTAHREAEKAVEEHARETATQWKWISILVGIPACGYLFARSFVFEEHPEEHKEYLSYDHLRIRKVQFPWGSESLFHSKHNYSPDRNESDDDVKKVSFITAWLKKTMDSESKENKRILEESIRSDHQKSMEYIERKKFTHYPPLPTFARMFGERQYALHDPIARRPVTFDD